MPHCLRQHHCLRKPHRLMQLHNFKSFKPIFFFLYFFLNGTLDFVFLTLPSGTLQQKFWPVHIYVPFIDLSPNTTLVPVLCKWNWTHKIVAGCRSLSVLPIKMTSLSMRSHEGSLPTFMTSPLTGVKTGESWWLLIKLEKRKISSELIKHLIEYDIHNF